MTSSTDQAPHEAGNRCLHAERLWPYGRPLPGDLVPAGPEEQEREQEKGSQVAPEGILDGVHLITLLLLAGTGLG